MPAVEAARKMPVSRKKLQIVAISADTLWQSNMFSGNPLFPAPTIRDSFTFVPNQAIPSVQLAKVHTASSVLSVEALVLGEGPRSPLKTDSTK